MCQSLLRILSTASQTPPRLKVFKANTPVRSQNAKKGVLTIRHIFAGHGRTKQR
jgi:hypothetical protein